MAVVRKAQPHEKDVHIDKPLTNISIAYIQDKDEYFAEDIFPRIPVEKKSDKYFKYNKNDWFRDEAKKRAPSTESAGSGYRQSTDTYDCDVWAFHKDIDDRVRSNEDEPLDAERDSTEFVMQRLLLRRDIDFTNKYFTASAWDTDKDGSGSDFDQWDDYSDSAPLDDVTAWRRNVKIKTGFKPNGLAIGGEVWDKLKNHPDILERIKYTRSAINISVDLVTSAFELDRIVVCEPIKATNEEGESGDYSMIVGKIGLLYYIPERPSIRKPSAGYTFAWTGYGGQNAYGVTIRNFRQERIRSDRIEGEMAYDMKVVASDLGVYLDNVVS